MLDSTKSENGRESLLYERKTFARQDIQKRIPIEKPMVEEDLCNLRQQGA